MHLLKLTRASYNSEVVYVNPKYIMAVSMHVPLKGVTEITVYPSPHPMLVNESVEDIIFDLRSNA
jgi:hypothetical protein